MALKKKRKTRSQIGLAWVVITLKTIEYLFVSGFTCALQKEILYQGKLFLSENWICFHSKVFGKDTKVSKMFVYRTVQFVGYQKFKLLCKARILILLSFI